MAGDWIPMRLDLSEDPAVMQIAEAMDLREEFVVGCLHKVWCWASRQCHDGSVTGVTLMSLERVTNVAGFVTAMRDAGWIDETTDASGRPVLLFPKWENWLSNSAKKRLMDAKRQQKRRGKPCHDNVTKMSRTKRDKSVTTGEERKGEKSIDAKASITSAFETWWTSYPKKVSKDAAAKAYVKAIRSIGGNPGDAATTLLNASLPRFERLARRDTQYIPNAATWLNSRGWEDDLEAISPQAKAIFGPGQNYDPNHDYEAEAF